MRVPQAGLDRHHCSAAAAPPELPESCWKTSLDGLKCSPGEQESAWCSALLCPFPLAEEILFFVGLLGLKMSLHPECQGLG